MAGKHYDLDISTNLGDKSPKDYYIPSQKAVKTYIDNVNTNVVHLSGTETITGNKTFSGTVIAPTVNSADNSTNVATTAYVQSVLPKVTFRDWSVS